MIHSIRENKCAIKNVTNHMTVCMCLLFNMFVIFVCKDVMYIMNSYYYVSRNNIRFVLMSFQGKTEKYMEKATFKE